ncbi:hypothetical protein NL676_006850 [Syzygium grande]|nr:hypothetical protein NL676_006850 [Syzygium grande]
MFSPLDSYKGSQGAACAGTSFFARPIQRLRCTIATLRTGHENPRIPSSHLGVVFACRWSLVPACHRSSHVAKCSGNVRVGAARRISLRRLERGSSSGDRKCKEARRPTVRCFYIAAEDLDQLDDAVVGAGKRTAETSPFGPALESWTSS